MWTPTNEDLEKCLFGKGCDSGICDECTLHKKDEEVEEDSEE